MRPRFGVRGPHPSQGIRPMGTANGLRGFPPRPPYQGRRPEFSRPDDGFVCESCDLQFENEEAYEGHMKEHQRCGIDGCNFSAKQPLLLAHIHAQHSSGLYAKVGNISTPEDIARWRVERKRNYPSRANIEARYAKQAEMKKRGERIQPKNERFPKRKERLVQRKKKRPVRKADRQHSPINPGSLINDRNDWNGAMFPFRGIKEEDDQRNDLITDDEWDNSEKSPEKTKNALQALIGAYDTATESENDDPVKESAILKQPVDLPDRDSDNMTRKKRVIKQEKNDSPIPAKKNKNSKKMSQKCRKQVVATRKATLLQKLLANEIRHERNVILQCIRYIVNNNFFD